MKKILALLGALTMGATTASTVVACGTTTKETDNNDKDKISALEAEITKLNEQIKKLESKQSENEKKVKDQQQKIDELTTSLKDSDERVANSEKTIASKEAEIKDLDNTLKRRDEHIEELHTHIANLNNTITELERSNVFLQNKINDLSQEKLQLEAHLTIKQLELTYLNDIKKFLETKLEVLDSKTITSATDKAEFEAQLQALVDKLSDFEEIEVDVPFFQDLIDYLKSVQTKLKDENLDWTAVQNELNDVVAKLKAEQPHLDEKIVAKKAEIAQEAAKIGELEAKIDELETEKEHARNTIEILINEKNDLNKALGEQEIEIEKLKADKQELEKQNAELTETTTNLREVVESLRKMVADQAALIKESEALVNELLEQKVELVQQRDQLERLLTKVVDLDEVIHTTDFGEISFATLTGSASAQSQRILQELQKILKEKNPYVLLDSVAFWINETTQLNHGSAAGRFTRTRTSAVLKGINNSGVYTTKSVTITFTIKVG